MQEKVSKLTPRELECLVLSYNGKSCKGIAQKLKVSKRTVDFHLANVFEKYKTTNRYACLLKACFANDFKIDLENVYKMKSEFSKKLSKKEREVAQLLPIVEEHKEIALMLNIVKRTVDFHVGNIYRKLEVPNENAAIAKLFEPIGDILHIGDNKNVVDTCS
jgi:DNA-binding NarL/FixJ family response regulator